MLYEFECSTCGTREDRDYSIRLAPPFGTALVCPQCRGASLRRIPSVPVIPAAALAAAGKYPYVSRKWDNATLGGGCRETPGGHPIVESARHERDIMARTGLVRD